MDALLNDYYTNIVDKAYHRLMTSDNVAKYRPEIIASLEAHSRSSRYKKAAAKDIAQIREISEEEADELVMNLLHGVIDAFRQMDRILEDINKKNSKYQRAAIGRARFLLSSSEDLKGQIRNILMNLNEHITEKKLDYNAVYELEEIDCGGFLIWKNLCEATGIPFITNKMDIPTYEKYIGYGRELTVRDRKQLSLMMEDPFFEEKKELFQQMIERGKKLEQECVTENNL